ncbi:MAG: hypothetical protein E7464_03625 [Ruminococcaceae bacterium]|nr:hypothetical protein [Oscillospiraceae bacterium]
MKKIQRLLSLFLAVSLLLLMLPTVQAADSGTCGSNLTWKLQNGTLTISGSGPMNDYLGAATPWEKTQVTSLIVENGVTTIGAGAFSNCEALTSAILGDSVTTIGSSAFYGCYDLENLTLPKGLKIIRDHGFACCWALTEISLPEGLTTLEHNAFYYCPALTGVQLPNSLTQFAETSFSGSDYISGFYVRADHPAFSNDDQGALYNKDKTKLILCPESFYGHFVVPGSVKEIGRTAFSGCFGLENITIPDGLTTIGEYAFSSCWGLKELILPDSVTKVGDGLCLGCEDLLYAKLPKGLTAITYSMFSSCESLKGIVLPDGVRSIGESAFYGCDRLTNITFPAGIQYLGSGAFAFCENLTDLYYPASEAQWNRSVRIEENAFVTELPNRTLRMHFNAKGPVFVPDHDCPAALFIDIPGSDHWAHTGIDYCVESGLMNGISELRFDPAGQVSRAQLVTILYRAAGNPWVEVQGRFSDVPEDTWYARAVEWAAANNIVNGVGNGKFAPDAAITREQIATILFRYDGGTKAEGSLDTYPDADKVSSFAVDAMLWAIEHKIITGASVGDVTWLNPLNSATREQIASIMMRYLNGK